MDTVRCGYRASIPGTHRAPDLVEGRVADGVGGLVAGAQRREGVAGVVHQIGAAPAVLGEERVDRLGRDLLEAASDSGVVPAQRAALETFWGQGSSLSTVISVLPLVCRPDAEAGGGFGGSWYGSAPWGQFHTTICFREPRVRGQAPNSPGLFSSSA
ncbi:hypothetical protein Psuf_067090 [Phytohabitans suffuscus]|uniref:Uncharacterized protein n=1 Tax=Phytohabitans suffuscus TaxID=624315 RepID=A0A6F8YTL8_9ACTN|nr:hypothetical protein Psuf_067090 [Phytohabitans suffuscus]